MQCAVVRKIASVTHKHWEKNLKLCFIMKLTLELNKSAFISL